MYQEEEHHYKNLPHRLVTSSIRKLGFRWYDMYYVERNLTRLNEAPDPVITLDIGLAGPDEEREIIERRPPQHEKRLRFRFASNRTSCYVAKIDSELIGYSMLSTGLLDMTGLDARELAIRQMPGDTGLTHDAYVFPAHRGQRVFHALLRHIYRDRKEAGFARVINLIDPSNVWSLKVHLDMGNKIQRVRFLKLPGTGLMTVGRDFHIGKLDC